MLFNAHVVVDCERRIAQFDVLLRLAKGDGASGYDYDDCTHSGQLEELHIWVKDNVAEAQLEEEEDDDDDGGDIWSWHRLLTSLEGATPARELCACTAERLYHERNTNANTVPTMASVLPAILEL